MQSIMRNECININRYSIRELSIKEIFLDNNNWDRFYFYHRDIVREIEKVEVEKMLKCKDAERGFFTYFCNNCNEAWNIYFGCNSRLCSNCGKNYTDKWASKLSKTMFSVPHRHIVLSISDKLWNFVRIYRELHKAMMDAAIKAINDTLSYKLRKDIIAGAIVVLHPFSRDLSFKPHIHVLLTEGGFDKSGKFHHVKFIPAKAMRKTWQYQILTRFKDILPKTKSISELIDYLFTNMMDFMHGYQRSLELLQKDRYQGILLDMSVILQLLTVGFVGIMVEP